MYLSRSSVSVPIVILISSLLYLLANPCSALASQGSETLSLKEAIDLALAASSEIANSKDTLETARSNLSLKLRADLINPTVKINAGVDALWGEDWRAYRDEKQITLNVGDTLPIGRYLSGPSGEEELAVLQVREAERNLEFVRADVVYRVMSAYIAVLKAQKSLALAQKSFELSQTLLQDVRTKLELGVASASDLLKSQQDLDKARADVSKAQSTLESACFQFNQLIGRPLEAPVTLADEFSYNLSAYELTEMVASALERRSEIQRVRDDLEKARISLDDAVQSQRPVVTISGGYTGKDLSVNLSAKSPRWDLDWQAGYQYAQGQVELPKMGTGWHAGLNISWTPFDGGVNKEREREARARVAQMERQVHEQESQVILSVHQAYNDFKAAQDAVLNAETSLRLAEENLKTIELRRERGYATDRDVSQAELAMIQARNNHEFAIYDCALAEARLRRASGLSIIY